MARIEPMADASLPAIRARSSPGTAMAARMPMIATTMSSSISVKPSLFRISQRPIGVPPYRIPGEVLRRAPRPVEVAMGLLQDLRAGHVHADRRAREVLVNGSAVVRRKCAGARLAQARRRGRRMIGRLRRGVVAAVGRGKN